MWGCSRRWSRLRSHNGIFDVWFYYQENKTSLIRIQREQAEAAAAKIGQFIREIESQLGWTTQLPWSAGSIEQRRFDALRLLRQVPAITELSQLGDGGDLPQQSRGVEPPLLDRASRPRQLRGRPTVPDELADLGGRSLGLLALNADERSLIFLITRNQTSKSRCTKAQP